jgi:hypothetical protein
VFLGRIRIELDGPSARLFGQLQVLRRRLGVAIQHREGVGLSALGHAYCGSSSIARSNMLMALRKSRRVKA